MNKFIYWLPRVLAILFIGFISLFALDVFGEVLWLTALLMHLIPSFVLIIVTVIAWKKEKIGGIIFLILGLLALVKFIWVVWVPMILIGVLFLIENKKPRN